MKKIANYFILVVIALCIISCATPMVMLNHNPKELTELKIDSAYTLPVFKEKSIILCFDGDLTTSPTGSYMNENYQLINAVDQIYLTVRPGYVLFEKIAEIMEKQGLRVYRQYSQEHKLSNDIENSKTITFKFIDFEFHLLHTKEGTDYFLVRSNTAYTTLNNNNNSTIKDTLTIKLKLSKNKDIFEESAGQIISKLNNKL